MHTRLGGERALPEILIDHLWEDSRPTEAKLHTWYTCVSLKSRLLKQLFRQIQDPSDKRFSLSMRSYRYTSRSMESAGSDWDSECVSVSEYCVGDGVGLYIVGYD